MRANFNQNLSESQSIITEGNTLHDWGKSHGIIIGVDRIILQYNLLYRHWSKTHSSILSGVIPIVIWIYFIVL